VRRHVAVHDAERGAVEFHELVRAVQTGQGVGNGAKMHGEREGPAPSAHDDVREGLPLEVLHHDDGLALILGNLVRLDDVGVIEPRGEPGLAQEHVPEFGIAGQVLLERLEDDELAEAARAARDREVHVRRSALPELDEDSVFPLRT
jgi:hypothetical protein